MLKAKILIVEDEGISALSIKSLLEMWGHKNPSIALSSDEALKNLEEFKPDLILMDINLNEEVDGVDIANQLKNDFDIPIVYITAHSDEKMMERAKLTEPYGYIVKPFSDEELKMTIDTALYRHKMEKKLKRSNELLQTELKKRNRAELALKKSEEKYRAIVETTHEGIVIFNEKNEVAYVNEQMAEMMGYGAKEPLGMHVFKFIDGKDMFKVQKELKIRNKGVKRNLELPLRKKDGSYIWTLITGNTLFDSKDNFIGILCMIKDISMRKEYEDELKRSKENLEEKVQKRTKKLQTANRMLIQEIAEHEKVKQNLIKSEEKFREIFNNATDMISLNRINEDGTPGRFIEVNDVGIKRLGYSREEFLHMTPYDIDKGHEIPKDFPLFFKRGHSTFESIHLTKNMKKIPVEINIHIIDYNGVKAGLAISRDITGRKKAERESRNMLEFLQTLIDTIPSPIFYKDNEGIYQGCNNAYSDFIGLKKESIIGKSVYDVFPKNMADKYYEMDSVLFRNPGKQVYEGQMIHADGYVHNVIFNKAIYFNDDAPAGLVGVMVDVTDLKKAEEALRESKERYRSLFQSSPYYTIILDIHGKLVDVNDAAEKFTGLKKSELIGKHFTELNIFPAEEIPRHVESVSILFNKGHVKLFESKIMDWKGKIHYVVNYLALLKKNDEIFGFQVISRDITKHKNAEEEKKREQQKLMDIIEFLPDATIVIDQDNKVIAWNRAIEKMTGVPKEKILGKGDHAYSVPFYGLKRPILIDLILSQDNEVKSFYDHVEREGDTLYADVFIHDKFGNGGKFLWGKASPLYDNKGKFVGAIESIRDISKRKNAERSIKEQFHFLQNLIDTIPYPIFYKDTECVYQGCNKAFEYITGLQKDKIIGKSVYDVSPGELAAKYHEKDRDLFKNPSTQIYEEKIRCVDGTIHDVIFNKKTYNNVNDDIAGLIGIIVDITERKETEESIKRSEAYYKTIFENTGAATFIVEEDTVMSLVNAEFEKLSGYTKEEIECKKSWKEFASSDYVEKMEEYHNLRRIDPDLAPRNYEFEFIDRYGNVKNVLTTVAMIPGAKKSLVSLLDITDKKTAVNSLRESEARLKIAMDMAKLVHWEYDIESDMFTFDDQFYTLYGTTAEEEGGAQMSSGEYARRFVPSEDSRIVAEETAKALKTDDPDFFRQVEHSIIRADGEKRFIVVRYGVVKDNTGRTIKTYGANQDITERKNAEEEISRNLKRLDILNKVILTANRSNNLKSFLKDVLSLVLEFMNFEGGGIYLIDSKKETAKLKHFIEDSNGFTNVMDNIKINEYPFVEVYIDGKSLFIDKFDENYPTSESRYFESLAVVPIYSKEKIIGSFNIISKKKHHFTQKEKEIINSIGREIGNSISKLIAEEEMRKLIKELKRSNDELQQFAYVTSHDLQEPLRTIASFTQLIERRYKNRLDSDADEFIGYIVEASIRMKQMILDLLEYSRVTKVEKKCKPLKVEKILINVLDSLNVLIKENNAEIIYENLPTVVADESQIFRVFQNLIENAIKFKKENENPKIHIECQIDKENGEYIFSVSDNGIGIEKRYFDRIFTIFQRLHTRDEYHGTGIGLSISRRIIENHGGRMWIESEPDVGSTFYFTISCAKL